MATEAAKARARPESRKSPGQGAHPALSARRFVSASHRRCAGPYGGDRPGYCTRHVLEQHISPVAAPQQAPSPRSSHHPEGASPTRDGPSVVDLVARRSCGKPTTAPLAVARRRGRDTGGWLGRGTGPGSGRTWRSPACRTGRTHAVTLDTTAPAVAGSPSVEHSFAAGPFRRRPQDCRHQMRTGPSSPEPIRRTRS